MGINATIIKLTKPHSREIASVNCIFIKNKLYLFGIRIEHFPGVSDPPTRTPL